MNQEEEHFISVGEKINDSEKSQLFGKACFKINGKAFVCFFSQAMVFKLAGDHHKAAMSLDGSQLFDPSGKGRPMKEWVQVPFNYKEHWEEFAQAACEYVSGK